MLSFLHSVRAAVGAAFVFSSISLFAVASSKAATLTFYNDGSPHVVGTVTGTGGVMSFTLNVDDPNLDNVAGNFALDVFGPLQQPARPYRPCRRPISSGGASGRFRCHRNPGCRFLPKRVRLGIWQSLAETFRSPSGDGLLIRIWTSPFTPVLTVTFSGDLALAQSAVPLPAALPMFAAGLGILGLRGRRRRKRAALAQPRPDCHRSVVSGCVIAAGQEIRRRRLSSGVAFASARHLS